MTWLVLRMRTNDIASCDTIMIIELSYCFLLHYMLDLFYKFLKQLHYITYNKQRGKTFMSIVVSKTKPNQNQNQLKRNEQNKL